MRGIAIPWGKCNIFQKKKHLFNILLLKKKPKNQTLHWLAGHPFPEHLMVDPGGVPGGGLCHPQSPSPTPDEYFGGGRVGDHSVGGCGHPRLLVGG